MHVCKAWPAGALLALVLATPAIQRARGPGCGRTAAGPGPGRPAAGLGPPVPFVPPPVTQTPLDYAPPPAVLPAPPPLDPGPNGWAPYEPPSSPPGCFFDVETVLLLPVLQRPHHERQRRRQRQQLHVPSVALDLTVSPKFEFGYRLPDSAGYFAGSYRFLTSQGTGTSDFDGDRLRHAPRGSTCETFDLDYGSAPYEVAPNYLICWRIGGQIPTSSSTRASERADQPAGQQQLFRLRAHVRLDVERRIEAVHGLSLFGRLDGRVLDRADHAGVPRGRRQPVGSTRTSATPPPHRSPCPILLLQVGVSYIPPIFTNVKFTTGYQFEDYWYLGQFNANGTPGILRGELQTQGWFFRGQVDF